MLWERVLAGDLRSAARLMRLADDRADGLAAELSQLFRHTGKAQVVGITGNPGAGKSSLVDSLIAVWRARGLRVAVVAVDPSSPFSGGAVLGDRIRMQRHSIDPGVFIRSVATRGALGGLSRSTSDIVTVMDAMGFDRILVETVGVGQDEVDVVRMAHTTVVVMVPGLGDEIQILKAGILEIADVFAVNKADRPGADRLVQELEGVQQLVSSGRHVPVVSTVAVRGDGVEQLVGCIDGHWATLHSTGEYGRREGKRLKELTLGLASESHCRSLQLAWQRLDSSQRLEEELTSRRVSPQELARILVESLAG